MTTYFEDRQFSDKMMPLVVTALHHIDNQALFGSLLNDSYSINAASEEQDRQYATDLVLQPRNLNISVRVRRTPAADYWPQLTLSDGKEHWGITQQNYVDLYFVGVASFDETRLSHWMVVNLQRFRECLRQDTSIFPLRKFRNQRGQFFRGYTLTADIPGLIVQAFPALSTRAGIFMPPRTAIPKTPGSRTVGGGIRMLTRAG